MHSHDCSGGKDLHDGPVERLRRNWYKGMWRDGVKAYRPSVIEIFDFLSSFHCEFDSYYGPLVADIRLYPDKIGTRTGYHYLSAFTNYPAGRPIFRRPLNILCHACCKYLDLTVTPLQVHLAHWTPRAHGGRLEIGSAYPLCAHCNLSAGTMEIYEWKKLPRVQRALEKNLDDYWARRSQHP